MNLVDHAKLELELAGLFDEDSDYNGMIGKAVLELVEAFSKQGHSGYSAGFTLDVFQKIARYENLTPLSNDPDEWVEVGNNIWQCKRNPAAFSSNLVTYTLTSDPSQAENMLVVKES